MKTLIFISSFILSLSVSGQKSSATDLKDKVSVDTIYIPIDLDDCLKQLDNMFADSTKTKIKNMTEDEFIGGYHHGFGTWLRNNWGLWKGSSLSQYFESLGVYHPDDMTGIIFNSFHRKLTGNDIKLSDQIKYYQDYWEKAKQKDIQRKNTEFVEYKVGDTVLFDYKNGFVSKKQETKFDNDNCIAKGVVTDKDEIKFFIKVILVDACDKRGVIYYDNKNSLVLDKSTNKWGKPKKRVITYMKAGEEKWFNYSDWQSNY